MKSIYHTEKERVSHTV